MKYSILFVAAAMAFALSCANETGTLKLQVKNNSATQDIGKMTVVVKAEKEVTYDWGSEIVGKGGTLVSTVKEAEIEYVDGKEYTATGTLTECSNADCSAGTQTSKTYTIKAENVDSTTVLDYP